MAAPSRTPGGLSSFDRARSLPSGREAGILRVVSALPLRTWRWVQMKGANQGRTLGSVAERGGALLLDAEPGAAPSEPRGIVATHPGASRSASKLGSRTWQGPAARRGAGGRAVRTPGIVATHPGASRSASKLGSRTWQGPAARRGAGGRVVRTLRLPSRTRVIPAWAPGSVAERSRALLLEAEPGAAPSEPRALPRRTPVVRAGAPGLGAERSRALLLDVEPGAAPSGPGHLVAMPGSEATATSVPLVSNSGGPHFAPRIHAPRRSNRGDRLRFQGAGSTELIGDRAGPTRGSNEHRHTFHAWIRSCSRCPSIRSVGGVAQPWR